MIERYTDHAANERTFLAWLRTAVAIIGFGVVVNRMGDGADGVTNTLTLVLIGLGALLTGFAALHFLHVRRRIAAPDKRPAHGSAFGITFVLLVATLIAMLGVFIVHLI